MTALHIVQWSFGVEEREQSRIDTHMQHRARSVVMNNNNNKKQEMMANVHRWWGYSAHRNCASWCIVHQRRMGHIIDIYKYIKYTKHWNSMQFFCVRFAAENNKFNASSRFFNSLEYYSASVLVCRCLHASQLVCMWLYALQCML